MAQEAFKSGGRYARYLTGFGIDVGCGDDPISPLAFQWDLPQGDAQLLEDVPDSMFDFVFSSHSLEHMRNPLEAVMNWWRVLRPGGYLIILVPDEDLYEQRIWPSVFNDDHKNSYTIHKQISPMPASVNLIDLLKHLPDHRIRSMEIFDTDYDYNLLAEGSASDQTRMGAEATIGVVVEKLIGDEARRTTLGTCFNCPKCRGEILVYGRTVDKKVWQVRCKQCNFVGKMDV